MCDRCFEVLKPADLQNALAGHFSKAAQSPVHDVTDWTSMRAWLNNPLTSSLEQDIYKCSNILGCAPALQSCLKASPQRASDDGRVGSPARAVAGTL